MSFSLFRNVGSTLYNYVASGLNRDGWSRVTVYDAYPEEIIASGLPAVSIELGDNFDSELQLGGGWISHYVVIVDIFAGFKGEKEDLSHLIKSYFDSTVTLNDYSNYTTPSGMDRTIDFEEVRMYNAPRDEKDIDEAYKFHEIITARANVSRAQGE